MRNPTLACGWLWVALRGRRINKGGHQAEAGGGALEPFFQLPPHPTLWVITVLWVELPEAYSKFPLGIYFINTCGNGWGFPGVGLVNSIFYITYPIFCLHYSTFGSLQSVFDLFIELFIID